MLVGFYISSPEKILMDTTLPYTLSAGFKSQQHLLSQNVLTNLLTDREPLFDVKILNF